LVYLKCFLYSFRVLWRFISSTLLFNMSFSFFFLSTYSIGFFSSHSHSFILLYLFITVCLAAFCRFRTSLHSSSYIHHFSGGFFLSPII
jgi:hypothetical protein